MLLQKNKILSCQIKQAVTFLSAETYKEELFHKGKGCQEQLPPATHNQEKQAYHNTTRSTPSPEERLPGSPQLSLLITGVIEQEVGPLVQLDD